MVETRDEQLMFYKDRVIDILASKTFEELLPYDFKITLFGAGLLSYRRETVLRPFPSFLVENDEKMFDQTFELFNAIPCICDINERTILLADVWRLIHWIISQDSVQIQLIKCEERPNLFKKYQPNYLFKVIAKEKPQFVEYKRRYGSFVGFHGSQVENFHSILYNGLINCLNKRNLFGSGTYLSTRIEVAIEFSPFGMGFKRSLIGQRLSCIAMCEVVKSPQMEECRSSAPSEYRIVKNDEHVQLTHLLVYSERSGKGSKFYFLLIGIVVLILSVALSNSPLFKKSVQNLLR